MKKLKSNKGITGVDITASIVIIMIAVGIITSMYSKYINNSKQVKRNTESNKIAMDFIQYLDKTDFDTLDALLDTEPDSKIEAVSDDFFEKFGESIGIPSGYKVTLTRQEEIDGIAMKLNIEVSYTIGSNEEKINLSTTKKKIITQVNKPDIYADEIKDYVREENKRYILKYSNTKQGYIKAKTSDDDWYSISGKSYPIVVYAKQENFDINTVISLDKCEEIYVWVPRFGMKNAENYVFCYDITNNPIVYGDTESSVNGIEIKGYKVNKDIEITNISNEFQNLTGKWIKVNSNLNPIDDSGNEITDENNILNILKTKTFTWN